LIAFGWRSAECGLIVNFLLYIYNAFYKNMDDPALGKAFGKPSGDVEAAMRGRGGMSSLP